MSRPPRPSAAVVLTRNRLANRQVFWVRRSSRVAFMPGHYSFPGGGVEPADHEAARYFHGPEELRPSLAAAVRETFEETGVLLGAARLDDLPATRKALLAKEIPFIEALERHQAQPAGVVFHEAARWVTPPFSPMRFSARFFVADCPEDQHPEVWEGELAMGEWIAPAAAVDLWRRGLALVPPPALHILRSLEREWDHAIELLRNPGFLNADSIPTKMEVTPGIHVVPLRTPTLPPATHTNLYIAGHGELVLIEPASGEAAELAVLDTCLDTLRREGKGPIREILITHHHGDHVGGLEAMRQKYGVPVRGHALNRDKLGAGALDGFIASGELIVIPGDPPLRLRALHTPGHAQGHLIFWEEDARAIIAGDMMAGVGTILIDPPEGHMGTYLQSLELMLDLHPHVILPAHGPAIGDARDAIRFYIQHRLKREEKIFSAVAAGAGTVEEIVPIAYDDTPPAAWPLAERSTLAHLEHLAGLGRVVENQGRYLTADRVR
ncbi:MAG: Hydroxyacylglutathione hydrolase [Myxococcota bacterium]|nr:Hydroxyacylglutathione hydrolase [Myxococcota bacterium]